MLTLHKDSHLALGQAVIQVKWLLRHFRDRTGFFIETVLLPYGLGDIPCGLFGPAMGDDPVAEAEAVYEARGSRSYPLRLVNREPRLTSQVTVIAGEHDGQPCVLFTAFGGPLTPREPGDPTLPEKDRLASEAFWKQHALAK